MDYNKFSQGEEKIFLSSEESVSNENCMENERNQSDTHHQEVEAIQKKKGRPKGSFKKGKESKTSKQERKERNVFPNILKKFYNKAKKTHFLCKAIENNVFKDQIFFN